jgi:AhpD family alkylhydroperoxidase
MRPFLDKASPEAWRAATTLASIVGTVARERGLSAAESELIKVRASQINGCAFCLDLHSREARQAGVSQQLLDLLSAWRETSVLDEREKAVLAIADASTALPLNERSTTELSAARAILGDDAFAAAEWIAVTINIFNRISILSGHPVRPRDAEGKLVR